MAAKLTLIEACAILNEGVSKGSYETTEESISNTSGNAYTTSFTNNVSNNSGFTTANTFGNAITHTTTESSTEWVDNPWYIKEEKLKEYALCGAVPYTEDPNGNVLFSYEDIISLHSDMHKVKDHLKAARNDNPNRKAMIIEAVISAVLIIFGIGTALIAGGSIENMQMGMPNMLCTALGIVGIAAICFQSTNYNTHIRAEHLAIYRDPTKLKAYRQNHSI